MIKSSTNDDVSVAETSVSVKANIMKNGKIITVELEPILDTINSNNTSYEAGLPVSMRPNKNTFIPVVVKTSSSNSDFSMGYIYLTTSGIFRLRPIDNTFQASSSYQQGTYSSTYFSYLGQ